MIHRAFIQPMQMIRGIGSFIFYSRAQFADLKEGMIRLKISTRTFDHFENGDRAIEPLYPSFFSDAGAREILAEPHYTKFKQALTEALADKKARAPLVQALMQSDVW